MVSEAGSKPECAYKGVDVIEVKKIGEHELQLIRYAYKGWRIGMLYLRVNSRSRRRVTNPYLHGFPS
jgi:hypothetical protein